MTEKIIKLATSNEKPEKEQNDDIMIVVEMRSYVKNKQGQVNELAGSHRFTVKDKTAYEDAMKQLKPMVKQSIKLAQESREKGSNIVIPEKPDIIT